MTVTTVGHVIVFIRLLVRSRVLRMERNIATQVEEVQVRTCTADLKIASTSSFISRLIMPSGPHADGEHDLEQRHQ